MATGLSGMDMLRFAGSLVLVLGLLGGLLWGLKRMQSGVRLSGGLRQLQVIDSVSVGPRQKIALVRVGGRDVLVGVSPTQLTALGSWPAASVDDSESPDAP
ncbi:MAG: flagellar biosynthetic protein FliO [Polaromonas sp.]|jgi:flagellar protein FliO/FliZ|nr:flagellar biosynthetic protein FliO [Polaromonas sp.]